MLIVTSNCSVFPAATSRAVAWPVHELVEVPGGT